MTHQRWKTAIEWLHFAAAGLEVGATVLSLRVASGAGRVVAAKGTPGAGKTVLAHFPAYTEKTAEVGASHFNIPTTIWNKVSNAEQWAANQKSLDRMIAPGG